MQPNSPTNRQSFPVPRPGRWARCVLAILAVGLLGVLATARVLEPDARGFGTHTQLGLGECAFRELTGKPCPACGMTTAFAFSVRGRWVEAWRANPAGALIAPFLAVALLPWLVVTSITGRTRPFRSADEPLVASVLIGVALALASWGVALLRRL